MPVNTYRDLTVWQKSTDLVVAIHQLIKKMPREEIWGLGSQMKRAALSIPSNIAEGSRRGSRKDYKRFIVIAYGSGAELETQITIAKKLNIVQQLDYEEIDKLISEIMPMLNSLIRKLS